MKGLKKGFTLIELLVVIAIIAILATIIILNVASARNKANDARVKDDVTTISKATEIAILDNVAFTAAATMDYFSSTIASSIKDSTGAALVGQAKHPKDVTACATTATFTLTTCYGWNTGGAAVTNKYVIAGGMSVTTTNTFACKTGGICAEAAAVPSP